MENDSSLRTFVPLSDIHSLSNFELSICSSNLQIKYGLNHEDYHKVNQALATLDPQKILTK